MSMENAPIRRQGLMVAALMLVYCLWVVAPAPVAKAQENPPPAAVADAAPAAPQPENFLVWFLRTSGWIGAIILALSVYFVAQTMTSWPQFDRLRDDPAFQSLLSDAEAGRANARAAFVEAGGERLLGK